MENTYSLRSDPEGSEKQHYVTPARSVFYAKVTKDLKLDTRVHFCDKPRSEKAQRAFQALALFLWDFFIKMRRVFEKSFEDRSHAGLELEIWKGDLIHQDFIDLRTGRKASQLEFRFIHMPGTVDETMDDIQLGTHWLEALKNRDGLSLEMRYFKYTYRIDGRPIKDRDPTVELTMQRAFIHQCEWILTTKDSSNASIDGTMDWFELDLRYSPTPAFPMAAYRDAYCLGEPEAGFVPRFGLECHPAMQNVSMEEENQEMPDRSPAPS
ncbi:hypothetical protein BDZ91DRAFT_788930 [Kalaharituber pfeilii]|nr:hypothetical protein BDZ91DRAFT_788930 [Kalaharituber pfeilii]